MSPRINFWISQAPSGVVSSLSTVRGRYEDVPDSEIVAESAGEKHSVQPNKAKVATAPAAKNLFNCMVTVLSIQESKDTTKGLLSKHL